MTLLIHRSSATAIIRRSRVRREMERSLEGRLRRGAIAPRVGGLHCIDPSPNALAAARATLRKHPNAKFHLAAVGRRFHPAERLYLTVLRKRADGRWRLFRDANLVS